MDEIRALQEELRRAQQSGSATRLSERNCVQLIMKLKELGLLEIMHTTDGKQFVTEDQLEQEIQDEVTVRGGRITILELEQIVVMDLSQIEVAITNIMKYNPAYYFVQGELLTTEYLNTICEEIDELLQEDGRLALSDLGMRFNLPLSFLTQVLEKRIGTIINGVLEQGALYTSAYIARQTARIRGLFSAFTRPTPVSTLLREHGFEERLFHSVLAQLIRAHRLSASVQGRSDKAVFCPDIVSRTQDAWVRNFFNENNYVEYDAVRRFGIPDPKGFVATRCKGIALESCVISETLLESATAAIDEALSSGGWIDVSEHLPTPLTPADITRVISLSPASARKGRPSEILGATIVCSRAFLDSCVAALQPDVQTAAQNTPVATTATPATPAPAQAAADETKGKKKDKGDKKSRTPSTTTAAAAAAASAAASGPAALSLQSLEKRLAEIAPTAPEEMLTEIAQKLQKPLIAQFQELQKTIFVNSGESGVRRKQREEQADKFRDAVIALRLCEKGLAVLKDDVTLHRGLLRTTALDACILLFQIQAADHNVTLPTLTLETLPRAAKLLPEPAQGALARAAELLAGKTVGPLLDHLEDVSGDLDVLLRKADRRRDKAILQANYDEGLARLASEADPATLLHRATLLIFQKATGCMLRAAGSAVPQIVSHLATVLPGPDHALLLSYQQRVMKLMGERRRAEGGDAAAQAAVIELEKSLQADGEKLRGLAAPVTQQ